MKALIVLLALVACPLIFGVFQVKRYETKLKPLLQRQAEGVLSCHGVADGQVSLNRLDATLEGTVDTLEQRDQIAVEVSEVGKPGALRVLDRDNHLKIHGDVDVQKVGDRYVASGHLSNPEATLKDVKANCEGVVTGEHYREPSVIATPEFVEWSKSYFALPGDRGYRVSSKNNIVYLNGKMTQKLQDRVVSAAQAKGITVRPEFEIIAPTPAQLHVNTTGGTLTAIGNLPDDYNLSALGVPANTEVKLDPFTEGDPAISKQEFQTWSKSYLSANGDHGYNLKNRQIKLSGVATPFLLADWQKVLTGIGLQPQEGKLELFPSEYHYPSYKSVSNLKPAIYQNLSKTLALNEIYFDTSSSEIKPSEQGKVDQIASVVNIAGQQAKYVIGGHADATGNLQNNLRLSAARAKSVVAALQVQGVNANLFEVVPFGAAKAKSAGSSANDRRVEILVK